MKGKELYIIRHGQTNFNKEGVIQGRGVDSDLNEVGQAQAQQFFEFYKHVQFDKVYTSTLKRTHQTVKPWLETGLPHEQLSALDEFDWGVHEGMPGTPERKAEFERILSEWRRGNLQIGPLEGETPLDVNQRQKDGLAHIFSQEDESRVLICIHGRCMRLLLCEILDRPLSDMDSFEHTNTCLYRLQHNGTNWELVDANSIAHLS